MGIFWEARSSDEAGLTATFREALMQAPPSESDADSRASQLAREAPAGAVQKLQVGRLLIALAIVVVLIGAGIGTAAADLADASKSLFGLATTAFGIVVGLLGGEKAS